MKKITLFYFVLQMACSFSQTSGNSQVNSAEDEIIVRFNYNYLEKEVVADKEKQVFPIQHLLNNQGVVEFNNKVEIPGLIMQPVRKIFPDMSWKDTITKNIYGEKIPTPPFWATFILRVPQKNQYCRVLERLNNAKGLVEFAHPNFPVMKMSDPPMILYTTNKFP
jgi:hypothetical protein